MTYAAMIQSVLYEILGRVDALLRDPVFWGIAGIAAVIGIINGVMERNKENRIGLHSVIYRVHGEGWRAGETHVGLTAAEENALAVLGRNGGRRKCDVKVFAGDARAAEAEARRLNGGG